VNEPSPITAFPTLDAILDAHTAALGTDFAGYRNHTCRVANLCLVLSSRDDAAREKRGSDVRREEDEGHKTEERCDKIAIAAAFHDLGIWTDHTFYYLEPSVSLATAWLAGCGKAAWTPEIAEMIRWHHKITPYRRRAAVRHVEAAIGKSSVEGALVEESFAEESLVESFRRADWIDVTGGLFVAGATRKLAAALYARWPDAGFHKRLVQLELRHLRQQPLNPLPVFKW
jgi:hypothetical protein